MRVILASLPGNEWLAYHPEKLVYNSSLQGDEYGAVRFNNQFRTLYPLEYYREKLKRKSKLFEAFECSNLNDSLKSKRR